MMARSSLTRYTAASSACEADSSSSRSAFEPAERLGQQVRLELAAQPPQSVSSVRRIGGIVSSVVMRFDHMPLPSTRGRLARWLPPVFKTSGAAPGVARWVRLPCAPARRIDGEARQSPAPERRTGAGGPPRTSRRAVEPRVLRDAAGVVDGERARLGAGETPRDVTTLGAAVEELIRARERGWREGLVPVINAIKVIVHTNLGRAPWPEEAGAIAIWAARTYLLLELDRQTGPAGPALRRR